MDLCQQCGKEVQAEGLRTKKFCDDACRYQYHNNKKKVVKVCKGCSDLAYQNEILGSQLHDLWSENEQLKLAVKELESEIYLMNSKGF
jgi:hypothetical protein